MSAANSGPLASDGEVDAGLSVGSLWSRQRRRVAGVIGILLLALLGTLVMLNLHHRRAEAAAVDAREMAESGLRTLLSYQSADAEKELDHELDLLTGPFRREYEQLMIRSIIPAAKKAEVVTRATVVASGVSKRSTGEVRLLIFVNVTTTSNELKDPRIQGSRLQVDVTKVDDVWKISGFAPV